MSVTPYNFQRPGPLANTLDHQFAGWLRAAAGLTTRRWRKELPGDFELQFRASETLLARDALAALPEGVLGYRTHLQERLPTLLVWPRPLALGILAALLCDPGKELPPDRELSVVEESLFEFFVKEMLPSFVETWNGPLPLRPELGNREPHPRWVRLFSPEESVLTTAFVLKGPFGEQEWRWLMPKKGIMASLDPGSVQAEETPGVQERLHHLVRELPVEITIRLGSVALPLSQLAQLHPGDVLVLDQRINQPLAASVAGVEKMTGWPCRLGDRQSFQIDRLEE